MFDVNDDAKGEYRRIEVLTGHGRRRRWPADQLAAVIRLATHHAAGLGERCWDNGNARLRSDRERSRSGGNGATHGVCRAGDRGRARRCGGSGLVRHGGCRPIDRGVARGARVGLPIMINVPAGARVLLATRPIDFRKGAHSLAVLAQEVLAEDPFSGAVIVYRAKRGDRLKILVWDSSGLVLVWKQLQQGSFRWPPIVDGVMKLSPVEFAALFDGLDWTRVQTVKGILKPSVAA